MPKPKKMPRHSPSHQAPVFRWERTLAATPRQMSRALEEVIRGLAKTRCPCGDLDEIRTALSEALNNALRHGCRLDPDKRIHLRCHCDPQTGLELSVRDEGSGFDPGRLPDPTAPENLERFGGRGIYLIRQLMDEVEFHAGGCEIRMRRRPRPQHAAASH